MPIYDFQCNKCKHNFESFLTTGQITDCPMCGAIDMTKMVTAPKTYKINGDNSASTSPRNSKNREEDRRLAKRERMEKWGEKANQ